MDLDAEVSKHAHAIAWSSRCQHRASDQRSTAFASGGCGGLQDGAVESVPSVSRQASATTLPYLPG